jgi:aspartate carbamoyltransferase catalytic subunit
MSKKLNMPMLNELYECMQAVKCTDVLYVTRIQRERFESEVRAV